MWEDESRVELAEGRKQIMVLVVQHKTGVQEREMQKWDYNKITRRESLRVGVQEKKEKPPPKNSAWITRASGMEGCCQ